MGCKIVPGPDGELQVKTFCGGNPQLFEALLLGIEKIGQELGYFPKPEEHSGSIIRIKP